jgi:hypothetical protein
MNLKEVLSRHVGATLAVVPIIAIALLITMFGCRPKIVTIPLESKIEIRERLVGFALPTDSAVLRAYFECDSNYNVLLKRVNEDKTAGMQSDIGYDSKTGILDYKIVWRIDTVYVQVTDTVRTKPQLVYLPCVEKKPKNERFFVIGLLSGIFLSFLPFLIIKKAKK